MLALCSSALRAAGHRVGETPKPHLVTLPRADRGRRPADRRRETSPGSSARRLLGRGSGSPAASARRPSSSCSPPWCSAGSPRRAVDVALVEVGLGGRLDATNAWDGGVAVHHQRRPRPHRPPRADDRPIAREKAAIIKRGDRAVTGATGEALAVVRRRAAAVGRAADRGAAGPAAGLGPRRHRRSSCPGSGRRGSACAAATRRPTSPSRTRPLDALEAAGIAAAPADGPAARLRRAPAGRAGSSWSRSRCPAGRREVLLDGAHNPAGRRRPGAGARRPAAVPRRRRRSGPAAAHPRLGVDGATRTSTGSSAALARVVAPWPGRDHLHPSRCDRRALAPESPGGAAGRRPRRAPGADVEPHRRGGRSSGPWRRRRARSSSPAPCTSSGPSARGSSTTPTCAIRAPHQAETAGQMTSEPSR